MNLDLLIMSGYGFYVWSAFIFTLFNFFVLYKITSKQFDKEYAKFVKKYNSLNQNQITLANKQSTNRTFVRTSVAHKI
tara:strand:- start:3177 stop:3410 length:234 start_codon:yes stop_codon:yes gene_type:complete